MSPIAHILTVAKRPKIGITTDFRMPEIVDSLGDIPVLFNAAMPKHVVEIRSDGVVVGAIVNVK